MGYQMIWLQITDRSFEAEFELFAKKWNFKHTTSSPNYPQSNGMAKRAVQTVKNLLKKARNYGRDPYLALLEYRNTPRDEVLGSPVQRMMSRLTKSLLPISEEMLKPNILDPEKIQLQLQHHKK